MASQIIYGVGSVFIIMLSLASDRVKAILAYPPIHWLGRVSFSLYLLHMPILYFCLASFSGKIPDTYIYMLSLILIALAAEAGYRWMERPSIQLGRYLSRPLKNSVPSLS